MFLYGRSKIWRSGTVSGDHESSEEDGFWGSVADSGKSDPGYDVGEGSDRAGTDRDRQDGRIWDTASCED